MCFKSTWEHRSPSKLKQWWLEHAPTYSWNMKESPCRLRGWMKTWHYVRFFNFFLERERYHGALGGNRRLIKLLYDSNLTLFLWASTPSSPHHPPILSMATISLAGPYWNEITTNLWGIFRLWWMSRWKSKNSSHGYGPYHHVGSNQPMGDLSNIFL